MNVRTPASYQPNLGMLTIEVFSAHPKPITCMHMLACLLYC